MAEPRAKKIQGHCGEVAKQEADNKVDLEPPGVRESEMIVLRMWKMRCVAKARPCWFSFAICWMPFSALVPMRSRSVMGSIKQCLIQ